MLHIALTPWPPPPPLGLALQSKNSRGTQHCRPHTHPAWWGSLSDEAIKGYTNHPKTYFGRLWVKSGLYRCFLVQNIESSLISVMFWKEGTKEEHKGRFIQNHTSKLPPEFNLTNDQIRPWTLNVEKSGLRFTNCGSGNMNQRIPKRPHCGYHIYPPYAMTLTKDVLLVEFVSMFVARIAWVGCVLWVVAICCSDTDLPWCTLLWTPFCWPRFVDPIL